MEPFNPQGQQFYLKFIDGFTEQTSFHLALLTSQEKSQLAKNDENYIKTFLPKPFYLNNEHVKHMSVYNPSVDVPKAEMNASESKRKYALSKCTRRTYILVPSDSSSLRKNVFKLCAWKLMKNSKSINLNRRHNKTAFLLSAWIIYFYRFLIWVTVVKVLTLKRSCLILSSSSSISGGSSS